MKKPIFISKCKMNMKSKTDKIIEENVNKLVNETTNRQKAQQSILGKKGNIRNFCIITSENPMGELFSPSDNKERYNDLISYIRRRQFLYFPVNGESDNNEHSIMIFNISLESSIQIGLHYNQESFIFATISDDTTQLNDDNGRIVTFSYYKKKNNNSYYDDEDIQKYVNATEDDDYFTAISRKFKFRISFKVFEANCEAVNNIIAERCKNDFYAENYQRWIDESIAPNKTLSHQHIQRAHLWSKNYMMLMN